MVATGAFGLVIGARYGNEAPTVLAGDQKDEIRAIAKSINDDCLHKTGQCFEDRVSQELVAKYEMSQILDALYDFDQYFSCHGFLHFVSRALFRRLGSVADAFAKVDFTCHGGAFHGIIEAYLEQRGQDLASLTGGQIEEICNDSKRRTSKHPGQVYNECLHGMGHAFMFLTDSNLPLSLDYCDHLEGGIESLGYNQRESCYGGAYMENSTSSTNLDHPAKWILLTDKFYPCTIVKIHQQDLCYLYQANYLIKESKYNFQNVFDDCATLSHEPFRAYCYLGIGTNLAGFSTAAGISRAAGVCALGNSEARQICVSGAIPSLSARYGGESKKLIEFCQNVASDLAQLCYLKLGNVMKGWGTTNEQLPQFCAKVGLRYYEACMGNTKLTPRF